MWGAGCKLAKPLESQRLRQRLSLLPGDQEALSGADQDGANRFALAWGQPGETVAVARLEENSDILC